MSTMKSPFFPVAPSTETLHEKLLRQIWRNASLTPDRLAFVTASDANKCITFLELYTQAHSVQAFLKQRGFKAGDIAALVLHNCIEWPVIVLGCWSAGGAISGASALFTDYELERQFLDSTCSIVFTDEAHLQKVQHATKNCTRIHTIVCLRPETTYHHHSIPLDVIDWATVLQTRPEFRIEKVDPSKLALLPYSSGTTGSPKGVMLAHKNFGTMIEVVKDHFDRHVVPRLGIRDFDWTKETYILNLPFYHIFGFGLLSMSILCGTQSVVMDKFDPHVYLNAIQIYRPRFLFLVPPILIFLAKHPAVKKFDISSVQMILSGAAPAGKDICEEFLKNHPNVKFLTQGYGMTECGMASHLPYLDVDDTYNGVGVICSSFEQKIIDTKTGKITPIGEPGEICVRGPCIMMGYLNREKATAETIDKQGWLHTGDIGYQTKNGRTFVVDRLKELIKVKGLQVPPAELEDLLLSHPLISDAAVIGLPDKNRGELVRAYVVRANDSLTEEDVSKFVEHKVSEYKRITGGVIFLPEIPKSAAGKILRRFLRDEAAKEKKGKKAKL